MSDLAPDSSADSSPPRKVDPTERRLDPAPEGREPSRERKQPMIPRSRSFLAILLALLAVNLVISFVTRGPANRERVPYQPFLFQPWATTTCWSPR